ncbi:hypothetical protein [Symbiopectobacterium purcellii]|uniref:hypothetical protein n=1 Tax=Symbiopectobacterium purcellii TaxID=2871826 RepID=UPI003F87FD4C
MGGYTKGPWKWWMSNSFRRLSGPDGKDGGVICPTVSRSDGHPDLIVRKADMALIESAPDLLEALEAVVRVADRDTVEFNMARAAIAKAKGGS